MYYGLHNIIKLVYCIFLIFCWPCISVYLSKY